MKLVNNRTAWKYPVNFIECEFYGHEIEEIDRGHFFSSYRYKEYYIHAESQDNLNKGIFYLTFPNTRPSSIEEVNEFEKMGMKYSFKYYDPCEIGCTFLEGSLITLIKYIDQLR